MNFIQAADSYFPLDFRTMAFQRVLSAFAVLWVILFAAGCIALVWNYRLACAEIRHAKVIEQGVYVSQNVTAPAVYGIFRPRIVFPDGFPKESFPYALLHERAHIQRFDNFFRCVGVVTACLHWFNPLSWVFLKCFFADMELACDARVVKQLPKEEKKRYAAALLSAAAGHSIFVSPFGGAKVRVRIERILSYKKMTVFSCIVCGIFIIALAVVLLSNTSGGLYAGS